MSHKSRQPFRAPEHLGFGWRGLGGALPLVALLLLLGVVVVAAHVELVSTSPAADARLDGAPGEITARFDGPVDPGRSGLVLVDRAGRELARNRGTAAGSHDRLALTPPPLAPGTYTVIWEVVAASDSHADSGYYTFSIGQPDPPLDLGISPERQRAGSAVVALSNAPADDGRQRFEALVIDSRGAPLSEVQRVQLRLRLQPQGAGPSIITLAPQGNGRYAAVTSLPGSAGRYDAEVQVRVRRANDIVARFAVEAAPPAPPEPTATSVPSPTAAPTPLPTMTPLPTPDAPALASTAAATSSTALADLPPSPTPSAPSP